MMINKYLVAAALAIFIVLTSYIVNFYFKLSYSISNDPAKWGELGDYIGGVLNPILSFISLVLLIKSLSLQIDANERLRIELSNNEKTGKLRSFEAQFFNMINSQKKSFDSFKVASNDNLIIRSGVEAVIDIEDKIERLREVHQGDEEIIKFLKDIDSNDQIFSVTRVFYIMVKMIIEKLSDANGFSSEDRKSHLLTLVNFTDFSLLRLIMISMQFLEYQSTEYLKNDQEFNSVLEEVGLKSHLY